MSGRSLAEKWFKNKTGQVVVLQAPNIPLWVWIVSTIAVHLLTKGPLYSALEVVALGSLFTWSYLEISQGADYFRRVLGIMVLAAIIIGHI